MNKTHISGDAPRSRSLIRNLSPAASGPLLGVSLFLVIGALVVVLASFAIRQHEHGAADELRSLAAAAAGLVDASAHERLQRSDDTGGADYQRAIGELVRFHNGQPWIEWIYTMRVREGRLYYVLDTASDAGLRLQRDRSYAVRVMEPVRDFYLDDEPGLLPAVLAGDTHLDQRDYPSQGRGFRSAQAPVRDAAGNVVAILAIDVDSERFRAGTRGILVRSALALLACLVLALAVAVITTRLHRALLAALGRIEREGITDPLTGLGNRSYVHAALAAAVAQAREQGLPLALLVIDVDQLRAINDMRGQPAGDQLLQVAGARLRELARGADVCCRIGGGEFALLMPGLGQRDAEGAFHRLAAAMRVPVAIDGEPLPVTLSGGIATLEDSATGGNELLRRAERALDDAKKAGRDRLAIAPGAT